MLGLQAYSHHAWFKRWFLLFRRNAHVKWDLCSWVLPFDLFRILLSVMLVPPLSDIPTKGRELTIQSHYKAPATDCETCWLRCGNWWLRLWSGKFPPFHQASEVEHVSRMSCAGFPCLKHNRGLSRISLRTSTRGKNGVGMKESLSGQKSQTGKKEKGGKKTKENY